MSTTRFFFPLTDEGIIVFVQGQKSRESEVVKVFDSCVREFVNLKPYIHVDETALPINSTAERIVAGDDRGGRHF